jgi:hypothetical protein
MLLDLTVSSRMTLWAIRRGNELSNVAESPRGWVLGRQAEIGRIGDMNFKLSSHSDDRGVLGESGEAYYRYAVASLIQVKRLGAVIWFQSDRRLLFDGIEDDESRKPPILRCIRPQRRNAGTWFYSTICAFAAIAIKSKA